MLTDAAGILLTGPDRGRRAPLGDSDGLAGRGWLGVVDDGSRFLVAHEPILDPGDARVLGLVIAGKSYPSLPELIAAATPDLLTYLLLGSALGVGGSLLLARRVKRQTLGLEPREIAGLVEHREAMLHGIKEGLMGTGHRRPGDARQRRGGPPARAAAGRHRPAAAARSSASRWLSC